MTILKEILSFEVLDSSLRYSSSLMMLSVMYSMVEESYYKTLMLLASMLSLKDLIEPKDT